MASLQETQAAIEELMLEIEPLFQPHCKLTFLMRNPRQADGDLILTSDNLDEIQHAIERLKTGRVWYGSRQAHVERATND